MDLTLWLKAFHIMAFVAWMVGMWYLPRLLVYHAEAPAGSDSVATLRVMERRLLKAIMTPAMLIAILLGIVLATTEGAWVDGWLHAKLLLVLLMAGCHGLLARHVRLGAGGSLPWPSRRYRIVNEVPTLLFVGIVVLAVVKPL